MTKFIAGVGVVAAFLLPLSARASAHEISPAWTHCGRQSVAAIPHGAGMVFAQHTSCQEARRVTRAVGKSKKTAFNCSWNGCDIGSFHCKQAGPYSGKVPSAGIYCADGIRKVLIIPPGGGVYTEAEEVSR